MTTQFNVEPLEPRKLLCAVPEPEFIPDAFGDGYDGYRAAGETMFGTGSPLRLRNGVMRDFQYWQMRDFPTHYGRLDAPAALDSLLDIDTRISDERTEDGLGYYRTFSEVSAFFVDIHNPGDIVDGDYQGPWDVSVYFGEREDRVYNAPEGYVRTTYLLQSLELHVQSDEWGNIESFEGTYKEIGHADLDGETTYDETTIIELPHEMFVGYLGSMVHAGSNAWEGASLAYGDIELRTDDDEVAGALSHFIHVDWDYNNGEHRLFTTPNGLLSLGCFVPPDMTGVTARGRSVDTNGDGLIDQAGRYIGGVVHDERIEAEFSGGTPSSVLFELDSDGHYQSVEDVDGSDGWWFEPEIQSLTNDATIRVTMNPGFSSEIVHEIHVDVAQPGILAGHQITWDHEDDTYEFTRNESLFGGDAVNVDAGELLAGQISQEDAQLFEVAFWQFGVDFRALETLELSMDPGDVPEMTDYRVVGVGTGFGGRELFRHEKPRDVSDGSVKLTFSITPPRPGFLDSAKLSFTFSGKLSWEYDNTISGPDGLWGWTQLDLSLSARMGFSFNTPYKQLAPLGSSGLALYGRAGVKIDAGGTATISQRVTAEPGNVTNDSNLSGAVEARLIPSVEAVVSAADPFAVFEFAEYVNAGLKLEGALIAKKSYSGEVDQDRDWTAELNGRIRISLVGRFFDWSGSIVLWTWGPYELIEGLNGPDPIIDSTLVHAGVPTLVSLESPTFESTPYVVTQTWDGSRWSDGVILGDDGRAKFGIDAAALGDGLGLVYSGHAQQRGTYGFEGVNAQSFVSDTELWFSRDGGQIVRLTSNDSADLSPRLVFSEDGLTGMLVWVRITGTIDKPVSQIMYRLWEGDGFGEETALTDPGRVADPQVRRLADGRFAINWRDADGNLHTRIRGEEWTDLSTLEIEGVYDILEIDGVLHAMAAARDPGIGYTGLKLYRYEDGAWTELGELSPFVSNITSLDAGYDGDGHLVVGLTNADGEIHAVYSGLVPLDDLGADVFVRADGGEWQPGDVSVLPAGSNRYHLAYGLFPTSLDQTEPPPAEIKRAEGSRLASGVHLIDGTPTRDSRVGGVSGAGGTLAVIAINENGAFVYERGSDIDGEGRVIDLGVPDAFAADTWAAGGLSRYVILSPGKVRVWVEGELTDLTELLEGDAIAEHLTVFEGRDGRVFLAGMTEEGELVAYIDAGGEWVYRNISAEDLGPQGLETPRFAGNVASYVTDWNGLTIAGIDENGDIQGIWWAPNLERWTVSNLSQITGAPQSVGNLAVTLTSWGGINLASTSVDGRLRVTWWVPSFGGSWVVSDLTENADGVGLQLRPETTFGYTTPWGALNFGGIDQTGELVVFWWTPIRDAWTPSSLNANSERTVSDLRSFVSSTGETSIVGENDDGEIVRHWWAIGRDRWESEMIGI